MTRPMRRSTLQRRAAPIVVLGGLGLGAAAQAAPADPAAPATQGASAYERVVARALAAAEQELADTNLWADHSTWSDPWVARTAHYEVRATRSHGATLDLASGLEAMLAHFQETLATDFAPTVPLQVYVFPDIAGYNQFGNQNGEHHSSFYGSFFAAGHAERPVAALASDNPTWLRMQVTHSVVHQYLAAAWPGRTIPTWLDEGLASYFAAWWDYGWSLDQFELLKAEDRVPSLSRLLTDGVDRYGNDAHARFTTLGMLFYYLIRFRDDTRTVTAEEGEERAPFRDYLKALLDGRPVESSPVHALFRDPAALERGLIAYDFPR